jgi:hypothetical protein
MCVFLPLLAMCLGAPCTAQAPGSADRSAALTGAKVQLMVVREVSSRSAKVGNRFRLRLNEPLVIGGVEIAPVGATAWGEVTSAEGTSAAGGRGRLSAKLLYLETSQGPLPLSGISGAAGSLNTVGVVLGLMSFGPLGLLNKGGNALLKGGDILTGYVAAK